MSNISVQTRMKQMLVLIILILAGILFALTAKAWDAQPSKQDNTQAGIAPVRLNN